GPLQAEAERITRHCRSFLAPLPNAFDERRCVLRATHSRVRLLRQPRRLPALHPRPEPETSPHGRSPSSRQTDLRLRQKELRQNQNLARQFSGPGQLTRSRLLPEIDRAFSSARSLPNRPRAYAVMRMDEAVAFS